MPKKHVLKFLVYKRPAKTWKFLKSLISKYLMQNDWKNRVRGDVSHFQIAKSGRRWQSQQMKWRAKKESLRELVGTWHFFALGVVVALDRVSILFLGKIVIKMWGNLHHGHPKRQTHNWTRKNETLKVLLSGLYEATFNITEMVAYSTGIDFIVLNDMMRSCFVIIDPI